MSETSFPISDLLRRKLQTSLVIVSLTLCSASTLFLLLLGEKLGFGILQMAEEKLTAGFSVIFARFIIFIGILVFVVGAVIVSFMIFIMMSHRVRDIGLMKGAGCPNDLIFGYFMTELLVIALIGCFLGTILGALSNFASTSLFSTVGFQVSEKPINFWLVLLVFASFFVLTLLFGAKPILDATRVEPAKAISPTFYVGLSKESGFKTLSKLAITVRIAGRSLIRRKSATFRIVLSLIIVFILATVAVAGGIIADQTTKKWVEKAIGRDIIVVAHQDMCSQYKHLSSRFYKTQETSTFNYTSEKYQISENLFDKLHSIAITDIDARLIMEEQVRELPGYILDPNGSTYSVGDSRIGVSLIVGVNPSEILNGWFVDGEVLDGTDSWEAIIGDSLAQKMFIAPLDQSIIVHDNIFDIVGVCLDPLNNGKVTYVPIGSLKSITGISKPNIALIKTSVINRVDAINQIKTAVKSVNSEFDAFDLNEVLDENLGFLSYIWSSVMLLPLFSLVAASLCLISYVILAIAEQHQEFGILRALGAKPATVVKIVSAQSLIVLVSSFAAGISLGVILTLLILIPEPMVTAYTIFEIAGWLLAALGAMFLLSLYPAMNFARKSILETISQS